MVQGLADAQLYWPSVGWRWAAPAKKNEASIFFPPAKIEGARGHNECRNATRITMDMDHKPARKGGGWNEEKNPSQESVPIRNFIRRLNI